MKISLMIFAAVFLLPLPTKVVAQGTGWTMITTSGNELRSCKIIVVSDSSVDFLAGDSLFSIALDSVQSLAHHRPRHFWSGAGYGTLAGVTMGAAIGAASYHESEGWNFVSRPVVAVGTGIFGGAVGFLVGGIIGAATGGDQTYDLSGEDGQGKARILRRAKEEK